MTDEGESNNSGLEDRAELTNQPITKPAMNPVITLIMFVDSYTVSN